MHLNQLLRAVLALLCLYFSHQVTAQRLTGKPFRDTLTIQLGENNRVVVPVENVRELQNIPSIDDLLQRLNRDLSTVYDSLVDPRYATTVIYLEEAGGGRTLKVNTKTSERTELNFNKATGQIERKVHTDSVIVGLKNNQKLFLILNNLAVLPELANQDIDTLVPEASREIAAYLAMRSKKDVFPYKGFYQAYYQPDAEVGKRLRMETQGAHTNDYLRIQTKVGTGLIRDKLVPELGFEAAIHFGGRRFLGVNTSMHYFFDRRDDRKYSMAINTFVTLEYAQTFNNGKWWQKFGVGYLVSRQGNYFGENTFKASLSLSAKKMEGFHLIPELFVTDNFKTAFPGLRVGIGF